MQSKDRNPCHTVSAFPGVVCAAFVSSAVKGFFFLASSNLPTWGFKLRNYSITKLRNLFIKAQRGIPLR
jgi:hypothetical protein